MLDVHDNRTDLQSRSCGGPSQETQTVSLRNIPILSPTRLFLQLERLRQYKYTRCRAQGVRRDPDDSPTTGESHFSPHRPAVLPRQSFPRVKAEKVERGDEERGITRGARTIQTVASIQDEKREEKEEENPLRHRIKILERSLANMRNKVLSNASHAC